MKKKLLSLIILVVAICLNIYIATEVSTTYAMTDRSLEISETMFFENQNRSIAVYDEVISHYRSIASQSKDETVTYSDDFAGVFIDDKGFLNIALVHPGQGEPTFNGQIFYQLHHFSYNYLQEIKEAVVDVMTIFDIHMVGIDEKENRVNVYISDASKIEKVSNYIIEQTWIDDTAVNYIVESTAIQQKSSYGGESISAAGFRGTICVTAIDNTTGLLGILTNKHVVPTGTSSNYRGHWNGSTFSANIALGTALRGQHAGTIDASFVPYANQGDWEISPYGRYDKTTYTNIKLGNNAQIIQGRAVKKIGQTSGITNGTITNANMTVTLNYGTHENPNIQKITNVFRYSNEGLGGDSGGPVYFNDGTDLHLIGMHFGGPLNPMTSTYGIACRIQNVMNVLDVTPITNDSFKTSNLTSTTVSLNGINFNPTGALVIPNQLNGSTVAQIGSSAFSGQTQLTQISIPSSVEYIGDYAFSNCTNLSQVDITDETTSILGSTPFSGCTQLYGTILSIKTGYHRIIDNAGRLIWMAHDFVYDGSYSSTHHDLVCQSCGYEDTKAHNKQVVNGIDICSVCPWVGDVHTNHEYTYSYFPIPHSGNFPINLHKAYCFCGEYIEEMCLGRIAEDGKAYCIHCGRDMTGALGQIINRILLPESDFHDNDIYCIGDGHSNDCCITNYDHFFSQPKNVLYMNVKRGDWIGYNKLNTNRIDMLE